MINETQQLTGPKLKICSIITFWILAAFNLFVGIYALYLNSGDPISFPYVGSFIFILIVAIVSSSNLNKKSFVLYIVSLIFSLLNSLLALIILFSVLFLRYFFSMFGMKSKDIHTIWAYTILFIIDIIPSIILICQYSDYKKLRNISMEQTFNNSEGLIKET